MVLAQFLIATPIVVGFTDRILSGAAAPSARPAGGSRGGPPSNVWFLAREARLGVARRRHGRVRCHRVRGRRLDDRRRQPRAKHARADDGDCDRDEPGGDRARTRAWSRAAGAVFIVNLSLTAVQQRRGPDGPRDSMICASRAGRPSSTCRRSAARRAHDRGSRSEWIRQDDAASCHRRPRSVAAGGVRVGGHRPCQARELAYVFQEDVFLRRSVRDNLELGLRLRSIDERRCARASTKPRSSGIAHCSTDARIDFGRRRTTGESGARAVPAGAARAAG